MNSTTYPNRPPLVGATSRSRCYRKQELAPTGKGKGGISTTYWSSALPWISCFGFRIYCVCFVSGGNDEAEIHRGNLRKEVHRPLTAPIVLGKCEKSLAFLLVS